MKQKIILILFISFCIAKAQWEKAPYIYEKDDMNLNAVISAIDENDIYIGTYYNGLFKSTDNGINWYKTNYTESIAPRAIDINDGSIYISTDAHYIQISNDGGKNWHQITSEIFYVNLSSIAASGDTIYTASKQHRSDSPSTLYRSFDGGKNWEYVTYDTLNFMRIHKIEIKNNYLVVGGYEGTFLSTDYGKTWAHYPEIYSNWKDISINNDNIFLSRYYGIIHTQNMGKTWNFINVSDSSEINSLHHFNGKLFAGSDSSRIFISSDNGASWKKVYVDKKAKHANISSIQSFGNFLYATTNNGGLGFYYSTDYGNTWIPRSNIYQKKVVNTITSTQAKIFAGVAEVGIFSSDDNAISWNKENMKSDSIKILGFDTETEHYFAFGFGGIFRSDNLGETWISKNNGVEIIDSLIIVDLQVTDKAVFTVTTNTIYKSTNIGETWININKELPKNIKITNITIYNHNILIGTKENGVLYSDINNINWLPFNLGLAEDEVTGFCISRNKLFASTKQSGIYVTEDLTDKWYSRNQNIIHFSISDLYSDSKNIFAVTPFGIMYSSDNGVKWYEINDGLEGNEEFCDFIVSDDEYLYTHITNLNTKTYATYRVERSYFNITSVKDLEIFNESNNISISPNPAEDYIEITIDGAHLEDDQHLEIAIFDILGNVVINYEFQITNYDNTHKINVFHLPKGVYFVRIGAKVEKFLKK